jgi:hypothetical protein
MWSQRRQSPRASPDVPSAAGPGDRTTAPDRRRYAWDRDWSRPALAPVGTSADAIAAIHALRTAISNTNVEGVTVALAEVKAKDADLDDPELSPLRAALTMLHQTMAKPSKIADSVKIVGLLLTAGARVDYPDKIGDYPLHYMIKHIMIAFSNHYYEDIFDRILEASVGVHNVKDGRGNTFAHCAVLSPPGGRILRKVIDRMDPDLTLLNKSGESVLHSAIRNNTSTNVEILLETDDRFNDQFLEGIYEFARQRNADGVLYDLTRDRIADHEAAFNARRIRNHVPLVDVHHGEAAPAATHVGAH